ncbi:MAG: hypothetical protein HGA76_10765, partial [Candidatus Firestonebacteria bacterium]|nr:hypothetical protein [Candidatus Firestonebacteria bacterium]
MTHVKGTGIRAVTEFLKGRYGDAGLEKIRQALTPEDQAIFKKPVMPLSWVD